MTGWGSDLLSVGGILERLMLRGGAGRWAMESKPPVVVSCLIGSLCFTMYSGDIYA